MIYVALNGHSAFWVLIVFLATISLIILINNYGIQQWRIWAFTNVDNIDILCEVALDDKFISKTMLSKYELNGRKYKEKWEQLYNVIHAGTGRTVEYEVADDYRFDRSLVGISKRGGALTITVFIAFLIYSVAQFNFWIASFFGLVAIVGISRSYKILLALLNSDKLRYGGPGGGQSS